MRGLQPQARLCSARGSMPLDICWMLVRFLLDQLQPTGKSWRKEDSVGEESHGHGHSTATAMVTAKQGKAGEKRIAWVKRVAATATARPWSRPQAGKSWRKRMSVGEEVRPATATAMVTAMVAAMVTTRAVLRRHILTLKVCVPGLFVCFLYLASIFAHIFYHC